MGSWAKRTPMPGARRRAFSICPQPCACALSADATKSAAQFGWEKCDTDWRAVVDDPEIDVIDITTPNDSHCEIALAAAGKAILCEKPLALSVAEAKRMTDAVRKARVVNMVCYNYRRVPALAREIITDGALGERLFHFRARYAQDWIVDPEFPLVWRLRSGPADSGSLGDIGSHIVDLGRYLVGEFREVCALSETFVKWRPLPENPRRRGEVTVDDAVCVVGRFRNGALASLEATRFAKGRKNGLTIEINGSAGSLVFDLERMYRLQFYNAHDPEKQRGFREILVAERMHPYTGQWWPPGHLIGYEHSFVHTIVDFVRAVVAQKISRRPSPMASPTSECSKRSRKARANGRGCGSSFAPRAPRSQRALSLCSRQSFASVVLLV